MSLIASARRAMACMATGRNHHGGALLRLACRYNLRKRKRLRLGGRRDVACETFIADSRCCGDSLLSEVLRGTVPWRQRISALQQPCRVAHGATSALKAGGGGINRFRRLLGAVAQKSSSSLARCASRKIYPRGYIDRLRGRRLRRTYGDQSKPSIMRSVNHRHARSP